MPKKYDGKHRRSDNVNRKWGEEPDPVIIDPKTGKAKESHQDEKK